MRAGALALVPALVVVLLIAQAVAPARAQDPLGVGAEVQTLRAATETMVATVERLPEAVRHDFEAEIQVLAQSIRQTLAEIENQPVPVVERSLLHQLGYLRDIVATTTRELQVAGDAVGREAEAAIERVQQLSAAAARPLGHLEASLQAWQAQVGNAVVEVEELADAVVVKTTSQLLYDAIRYGAAALFLVGLLVVGLRLLMLGESEVGLLDLFKHAPLMSGLGSVAVLAFLVATLVLALNPGALAGPSQVRIEPLHHPCAALAAQRRHLWEAQQLEVESLVEIVTQRLEALAQGCLGLTSPEAAARAVARFAASPPEAIAGPAVAAHDPDVGLREDLDRLITVLGELAAQMPLAPAGPLQARAAALAEEVAAELAPEETPAAAAPVAEPEPAVEEGEEATAVAEPGAAPQPAQPTPREFVTTTAVNIRTAPSLDALRLGVLPEGTRVLLLGQENGWSAVQLDDGRSVYVSSEFIRPAG